MQGQTNRKIIRGKLQRKLRNHPTDAEHRLWQCLRGRQLDGCKFRRQHPYQDYILDFVCLERKLVVEVDGGQHSGSLRDAARDNLLREGGFVTLRFWNHEVLLYCDAVVDMIHRTLVDRRPPHPHPIPPLEGEGEKAF